MTSKLTIEQAKRLRNDFECWQQDYDPKDDKEQYDMFGRGMAAMDMLIAGMYQEPEPELNPANLANKFYERYPLATFKNDSERAEAFGYFLAGAELQCFGEFIKYEDLCGDE